MKQGNNIVFVDKVTADHDYFSLTARNATKQREGKIIAADTDQKKQTGQCGQNGGHNHRHDGGGPIMHLGNGVRAEIATN